MGRSLDLTIFFGAKWLSNRFLIGLQLSQQRWGDSESAARHKSTMKNNLRHLIRKKR